MKIRTKKHGIDFETAILAFGDMQRIEIFDIEHRVEEDRTIGSDKKVREIIK